MFTLITTRAQITKYHHPLLHLNYLVTPSQFCVYNPKRRLQRYRKAAIFSRSLRLLEVKRLREIEGSNESFRCFWRKQNDGDAEFEAEIMEFMEKSEKPSMFPTKEELLKAGRMDLVEAIKKKGGWYSLGWEGENVDEDADFKTEEFQRRVESCSESSSLGETDFNSRQLPWPSSGISLEIGAEEDAGIEGILSRLEKQRNADFGITLGNYGFGTYALSKDEGESRHVETSVDVGFGTPKEREKNTKDIADPGKNIRLTSDFAHKGMLDNPGGMISPTNEPEMWRTWSSRQAGFRELEAADISLSENQVERNEEASINERTIVSKEYAEALDCHKGSNQNQVQTRLKDMELKLTTALQFLRSKKYIAKEVAGSSSSDLQMVSDAWEFRENELMNSQERLRSILAQLAVLEGKMTLAITDAQKMLEEKQKRIDSARRALQLLRTVCIVWPKSASEVLLAGSFDGWTTQIKFIVDGIWKVDPLRPITHNGRCENNLRIIT